MHAAQPERLEWLFNNLRFRAGQAAGFLQHLRVPQAMRLCVQKCAAGFGKSKARATLKLKCKVFQMRKLLEHNTAFYCPVARQMVPSQVLFRRLGQSLWTQTGWRRWIQRVCRTA